MRIKVCARNKIVTVSVLGLAGILTWGLVCPSNLNVQAEEDSASNLSRSADASSVAIALDARMDLAILPTTAGEVSYKATDLSISTTKTNGFRVLINGESTNLKRTNHPEETGITSIKDKTVLSDFSDNSWGIYLGTVNPTSSTTFRPVTTTPSELVYNDLANASSTYKLAIAAKADTSLPAGTYRGDIVVSVVAEPEEVFGGIRYMQDMTADICSAAEENDTMQLIDKRDNKSYWVAKLKDGNCWMTQNLGLNLSTAETLSSDTTNVSSYTPSFSTNSYNLNGTPHTGTTTQSAPYNHAQFSWSIGEVALATPLATTSCAAYGKSQWNIAQSLKLDDDPESLCGAQGLIDVSGEEWRPTFTAQLGDFTFDTTTKTIKSTPNPSGDTWIAVNTAAKTYDAHYLIGNYYQANTLLAGTYSSTVAQNVNLQRNLCPSGWTLPTGGTSGFGTNKSIQYLLRQYGFVSSSTALRGGSIENGEYNIAKPPLYFARAGYAGLMEGYVVEAGGLGYYTTRTSAGSTGNISLLYNYNFTTDLNASYNDRLQYGFTARCLLQ